MMRTTPQLGGSTPLPVHVDGPPPPLIRASDSGTRHGVSYLQDGPPTP